MKQAVAYLNPYIEAEKEEGQTNGKILMATVKGDVHDIGKNIVGVVLQCNNYEVIDLGVMVPCQTIIDTAIKENVDIIGLSGLITPSLDEMVHVAKECQRQGLDLPILIGGATTSKAHTAVKINNNYEHPVVYVPNASRSVSVVSSLLSKELRSKFLEQLDKDYERVVEQHQRKRDNTQYISFEQARENKFLPDWQNYEPVKPKKLGIHQWDDIAIATLRNYIDWTPFFLTWQLSGKYPAILKHEVVGEQAQKVFEDANALLDRLEASGEVKAKAVFGLFAASSEQESTEIYDDNGDVLTQLHHLRQQIKTRNASPNYCLADFVAPKSSGKQDYMGAFAVSAGFGADELAESFLAEHDDYNNILVKAVADRLAEALAEYLHQQVRVEYWGYAEGEDLSNDDLIREKYQGIRPAPGYPACPEHTEKQKLWDLLQVEQRIGMSLTESFAMWPTAAVSGWYFAHPDSKYFAVSRIDEAQKQAYMALKGWDDRTAELWLGPNL
eukprot:NODE_433_length_1955_cov_66.736324_g426_i0.p1 GENE.NODE_433_length_1955_cov_66.736324_g426_i0~~NODE_433_length_1955_cov_66.736324_g426_i0.p1  ORF type:complete len:547 (+),score=27.88 NODE_433_length_1955_cov_66.736324_g426_i0:146-1642(+)